MEYEVGFRLFCQNCKSECEVYHNMDSHQYELDYCPFCGAEIDEDNREEIHEGE